MSSDREKVLVKDCSSSRANQKWKFANYDPSKLAKDDKKMNSVVNWSQDEEGDNDI